MTPQAARILGEALRLPEAERTLIAERLLASLAPEADEQVDEELAAELDRRLEEYQRDPTAAVPFLERAAEANQADAQHMLATLYRDGIGIPRDETQAKALYDRAARQHHAASMFNLADMLRGGSPEERTRSIELYRSLACMTDEHQIQPRAVGRLRAMQETYSCR